MHKLRGYSWATKNNVERIYYVYSPAQNYFFAYWDDPQFLRNAAVCLLLFAQKFGIVRIDQILHFPRLKLVQPISQRPGVRFQ
jgi:hypothetical protein